MTLKEDPEGKYVFPILVEVEAGPELSDSERSLLEARHDFYMRRAQRAADGENWTIPVDVRMLRELIEALRDVEDASVEVGDGCYEVNALAWQRFQAAFKPFTGRI